MTAPRPRSQHRRPAMGRSRVGRRRPPRRSHLWLALPLALVVLAAVTAFVLLGRDREPPAPPSTADAAPATVEGPAASPQVLQATDSTPPERSFEEEELLTPQAANVLFSDARRRGARVDQPLDAALYVASLGFSSMDVATLDELSGLFAEVWNSRPPGERDRILGYVRYARTGDLPSSSEVEAGRQLFREATHSLPPASRERLSLLLEMAIAVGAQSRQQAEERGRVAVQSAPLLEEQPPGWGNADTVAHVGQPEAKTSRTPPSVDSRSGDATLARARAERERQETYWRGRAAAARRAVEAAEARVRELEEKARRLGPYTPLPDGAACQTGIGPSMARGVVELRDSSVGAVTCSSEVLAQREARQVHAQLEAARANVERQRKALDDLAEEARRAGALPGWLR